MWPFSYHWQTRYDLMLGDRWQLLKKTQQINQIYCRYDGNQHKQWKVGQPCIPGRKLSTHTPRKAPKHHHYCTWSVPPLQQAPPLVCQDGPDRSISPASPPDFGAVEPMSILHNHIPPSQPGLVGLFHSHRHPGCTRPYRMCWTTIYDTDAPSAPHMLDQKASSYGAEVSLVMVTCK